ncbi:hypothetical protein [Clostridium baratii]|uniref:hypothetical protein n=1 Tax=Clostridium baratii TaxID=1561 RepID=UPI0022E786CA|nr:hypothetical protein [Clostridium baratii]
MNNSKSKNIALGGILVALTIITLYLSLLIPINTFAIFTISSIFPAIAIMRSDVKLGVFVYLASSVIGFFIIPFDKILPFILYFGVYGIVKFFIEKLKNMPVEIILKLLFSNVMFFIGIYVLKSFITIDIKFPWYIIIIIAQVAFLIYDYALTLIITFYLSRIHKRI